MAAALARSPHAAHLTPVRRSFAVFFLTTAVAAAEAESSASASEEEEEEENKEDDDDGEEKAFKGESSNANSLALTTAPETPPSLETAAVISGDAARSPASAKGSRARQRLLASFPCCCCCCLVLFLLLLLSETTSAAAVAAAAGARNLSRAAKPAHPNARAFSASWTTQHELERSPPTRAMRSGGGGEGEGEGG